MQFISNNRCPGPWAARGAVLVAVVASLSACGGADPAVDQDREAAAAMHAAITKARELNAPKVKGERTPITVQKTN